MIPAGWFPIVNRLGIRTGDRVIAVGPHSSPVVGTVTMIWLGIEETITVTTDNLKRTQFCPALGDQIVVLP